MENQRQRLKPNMMLDAATRVFQDATVSQSKNMVTVNYRVEMGQNIEHEVIPELSELLSLMINTSERVYFHCFDDGSVGNFKINFILPDSSGISEPEITKIETSSGIKTAAEYRKGLERQELALREMLSKIPTRESYKVSDEFDPDDEASIRREFEKALKWMNDTADPRMNVDFQKLKQSKELSNLVESTNFGVFTEKTITKPEPNEDFSSSLVTLRNEFEDTGFFKWNLVGELKDKFADMIMLSDGVFITVGFYDDEKSIEFLLGVNDVFIGKIE